MTVGLLLFGVAGLVLFRMVTRRVPTLERARQIDPQQLTVTFADVAGVDEAKDEVSKIVDFLKEPGRFESIGGRIPRGILLVGPPGIGKALLARSMAGEAGVPFISASGSDFVEMDGFTRSDSIIVVAATNRQDILDPALLPDADPLHKVTIIPRGRALGVTMQLPEADRYTHSKRFIEAQIAILMGGRGAEELFLRQMTSGASNDIECATELACKMVCEPGMSPLGPRHFRKPSTAWDADTRASGFSEETARRVDEKIRTLVMRGYETARQIVERSARR